MPRVYPKDLRGGNVSRASLVTRKQIAREVRERLARESIAAAEHLRGRKYSAEEMLMHLNDFFGYWGERERVQIALHISKERKPDNG